ncbi:MAG: phenylalanine--tRNA ligase subunit beta [bacterium]
MRVSYKYLKKIVDFPFSPEELAEQLTKVGLEVRTVEPFGRLEKVVVGRILSIKPHPDADRIKLVKLDVGDKAVSLVCGAPNIKPHLMVPVALEGAVLRGGIKVRKVRVRGVDSPGMICSEDELGLGKDQSGVMVLPSYLNPGMNLSQALDLEDTVLDLEITPNRGDCLCMVGIAREVAALTQRKLNLPSYRISKERVSSLEGVQIEIRDRDLCPYYSARLIKDVKVEPSPLWLWQKVVLSGAKPINNVVDITNYVLWEMGQPLHAFDYRLITNQKIIVRRAKNHEVLITLDGIPRELDEDMLAIADPAGPIALAGVMGGQDSQVTQTTRHILLEAAYFNPESIQRTSRRLGLSTEASHRFEKTVDPSGVRKALNRAAFLLQTVAGGKIEGPIRDAGWLPDRKRWTFLRPSRTRRILGSRISSSRMKKILESLQFDVVEKDKTWRIGIPSFRPDITREIDLIEEIARFYGYNRLRISFPPLGGEESREGLEEIYRKKSRETLKGLGFYEVIASGLGEESLFQKTGFSLKEEVRIRNPLSTQGEILTSHLFPHLLAIVDHNLNQGIEQLRIFELATVFKKDHPLQEIPLLAGLVLERGFDFLSLKGIGEILLEGLEIKDVEYTPCDCGYFSPRQRAAVKKGKTLIGRLGRLNQRIAENFQLSFPLYLFEFVFPNLVSSRTKEKKFKPLPKFPSIQRDLALVVKEEVPAKRVREEIIKAGGKWLEKVELFDIYRGGSVPPRYKSLAYSLTFRCWDRTLRDEEVARIQQVIVRLLKERLGASLREK